MILKILLSLILVFGISSADEIQEDKKKISFSFEVINIDLYPDYVFLAYPVNTSSGKPEIECIELKQGALISLPCKFGPAPGIYAIKKELYNPEIFKTEKESNTKVLDSIFANNKSLIPSVTVSCIGYADKNASYSGIKEQYKIESIAPDKMIINIEKTIKTDKNGNVIDESKGGLLNEQNNNYVYYSLPFISMVLIVSIIFIRKMKNK